MPAGRKRKPTKRKIAEGNPGKRAINVFDAQRESSDPACPSHLDERAKRIFKFLVAELRSDGILAARDSIKLGQLAQAYSTAIAAQEAMNKLPEGARLLVKTPNGYPVQNPLLGIIATQTKIVERLASSFGLDPAARAALDIEAAARGAARDDGPDPLEQALAKDGPAAQSVH